ncbi:hypothetical protein JAAARDRAFT_126163 [Jaapia argillacea MUCL 33604]|uniref:DUF7137 domain-containing protein n=1 Tax=Jaapia argillacea MUCL 33604 TaxID=933084 RepID=A0A067PZX6_9AGAM|nr:hypothetical protein JAAARDRAFT_126163 [Jaapia argillacea MUCL 33604]
MERRQQQSSITSAPASSTSRLVIPATAPVGGLTITQPPQAVVSYYKIAPDNPITFGWNFTNLIVTPTHLTVSAVGGNGNTYAVGPTNGVIPGTATSVVWDPYQYNQMNQGTPLVPGTYTLEIWDDRGPNAQEEPGYLMENSALQFALYTPGVSQPIGSGYQCPGCSGSASSYTAHPAFSALVATFTVILLSGYGLLRHAWH